MRGPGATAAMPSSAGRGEARSSGRATGGPLSDQPTRVGPKRAASTPEPAVGREAFEIYETALARLRGRDQRAIRGRIEEQRPYAALAESLGVENADAARVVVTRALCRLVEEMSR